MQKSRLVGLVRWVQIRAWTLRLFLEPQSLIPRVILQKVLISSTPKQPKIEDAGKLRVSPQGLCQRHEALPSAEAEMPSLGLAQTIMGFFIFANDNQARTSQTRSNTGRPGYPQIINPERQPNTTLDPASQARVGWDLSLPQHSRNTCCVGLRYHAPLPRCLAEYQILLCSMSVSTVFCRFHRELVFSLNTHTYTDLVLHLFVPLSLSQYVISHVSYL